MKTLSKSWENSEHARSIFNCPHCQAKCQFRIVWHSALPMQIQQISGKIPYYVLQCTACENFIFLHTTSSNNILPHIPKIVYQFPPVGIKPHSSLPAVVSIDFKEASICLSAGAWNATTVMCRRALQSCAKDKKANPKEDLFDQLKELKEKEIIHDVLYDAADSIRKKGNIGAHPGKKPIINDSISETEARSIFGLTEQIFRYIYQLPSEVQALK
jgi:hypothetical protein